MDPITIGVIVFLLFEAGSGGFATANVAGGVAGAGSGVWRETKSGASARYKKRAKRLKKTRLGRWRLRTEAAIAGAVRGATRGVVAGAKGVPGGARIGRELAAKNRQRSRQVIGGAKAKTKSGAAKVAEKWRGWQAGDAPLDSDGERQDATEDPPPVAHCQYCGNAIVGGVCSYCGQDPTKPFVGTTADPCRCCGGNHGRQMTGGEHCDMCDRHGTDARFPETAEQEARRHVREQLERDAAAKDAPGDDMDDEYRPSVDDLTIEEHEHEEAIAAARTKRCVWHIRDQGFDGPTVLCGQKIRDGYIFCDEHLDQIEESGQSPHDFMFHLQDVEDEHLDPRQDVPERTRDQAEILRQFDTQASPVPSGSEQEDQMSTNTSEVAEDKGSIPYVAAWQGEVGIAERLVSLGAEIKDRISQAIDANARHEIGGGQDVVGKWQAVVEAIQAAGEATDAHAAALDTAWSATNEKLAGHAASSAQDLAGAH